MPFIGTQPAESALTTGHLGADIVTNAKIADDQIDSEHYVNGSIDTAHIAANQIDGTLTKDALIADYSDVTITASDLIMYGDATDSNNTKRDTVQGVLDLVSAGFTLGTEQASTSGNTVTFGSIPAGTKMIIISLEGVSLNGTVGNFTVQIGDSVGLETSGYLGGAWASTGLTATAGEAFRLYSQHASDLMSGHVILTLKDASNFTWISSSSIWGTNRSAISGGLKSLSAELTQVAVKASADSFDAGSINIMYM
jgi:hypothetical protein